MLTVRRLNHRQPVWCALKPSGQLLPGRFHGGKIEHQTLLLVDRTYEFYPVQEQEHFHGGVCDTFVATDERTASGRSRGPHFELA